MKVKKEETIEDIAWHPAFVEAILLELAQDNDVLQIISEHQLTAEPLRIDLVIIKKLKNILLTKNIATIFRIYNLVEYKSPTDYLSIADFYKVYGYACLYISLNEVSISDLTITFVTSRYSRKLMTHLKNVRGYTVEERVPGIYTVIGDIIPIQIIDSRKLPKDENIWLRGLDNKLNVAQLNQLTKEIGRLNKADHIGAYVDAISRANTETIKEAMKMSKSTLTLEQLLIDTGLAAKLETKGEAKGKLEGKLELARNLVNMGVSPKKIAQASGLDIETVKSLIKS